MSFGTKYFGGKIDETEAWTCEPMPHIEDGFTLVFNIQNWDRRHELLRNIFATVGPNFQPLIPEFCMKQPFERARRDWIAEVQHLLTTHGMSRIFLEIMDEVKDLTETEMDL